ncbi:hypothetical protein D3C72_911530 [compost metagenome]
MESGQGAHDRRHYVRAAIAHSGKILTFDLVEMREGYGQLVLKATKRKSLENRKRRGLHRLLCIVDEQDDVDELELAGDVGREAGGVIRRMADALAVDEDHLCGGPIYGGMQGALEADPVDDRRQ